MSIGYEWESDRQERQRAHIKAAPNVAEAVRRAASCVGVSVEHDYQAKAIAEAAQGFADTVLGNRQMAPRPQWEDAGFRDYLRQRMRRELLDTVTSQGLLPVALPRETLRFTVASCLNPGGGREVSESGDWDEVTVTLEVPVRTPPVDREAAVRAGVLGG